LRWRSTKSLLQSGCDADAAPSNSNIHSAFEYRNRGAGQAP
jgi:hypothetical protein